MTATADMTGAMLSWSRLKADGGVDRPGAGGGLDRPAAGGGFDRPGAGGGFDLPRADGWEGLALAPEAAARVRAIPSLYAERSWSAATQIPGGRRGLAVLLEGGSAGTNIVRVLAAELDRPALVADVWTWRRAGRAAALRALARLWAAGEPSGAVILLEHCEALLTAGSAPPATSKAGSGLPGTPNAASGLPGTPGFTARDAREVVRRGQAHPGVVVFATAAAVPAELRGLFDVVVVGEEFAASASVAPGASESVVATAVPRQRSEPVVFEGGERTVPGAAEPRVPAGAESAEPRVPAGAEPAAPTLPEPTAPARADHPGTPWADAPSSLSTATQPRPVRWRRARRALRLVPVVGIGAATAVALGLSAAPRTTPAIPLRFEQTAAQGPLRMTDPTAWRRVSTPALRGLTLTDAVAVSSLQEPVGRLVVGITHPASGSPLPAGFIAATLPGSPAPELVRLGHHLFARVLDPRLLLHSASSSVYALAAGSRAVVAVCQTASQSFVAACEHALGTLQIATTPPDSRMAYARALDQVLRALDHARAVHGRALAQASTAAAQAAAADDLAGDDGHGAASVARLPAGAATAENASLAGVLRRGAAAYAALAAAAGRGDSIGYARAQAAVSAANAAAESALHALTRLGYRVG